MTLESGDMVPEECEAVGEVPLVLPAAEVDPLDFGATEFPWAFRLPLAENVDAPGGIRAFVEGGEADDDVRPREVCGDFGIPFSLLRMELKSREEVPSECAPFHVPFAFESGCGLPGGGTGRCAFEEGPYIESPIRGYPGGTWEIISYENSAGIDRGPGFSIYSGVYDADGNAVGFPSPITLRSSTLVPLGTGTRGNYIGFEWRGDCP